ncbi:hypothetical protein D9Q98_009280 [Chlorella vulgaris]|uniref:Hemerythrin-like domain-containing protein n=1 Tax=Chlorella vulgaris TaxID=3077 RepID=A0A9D4YWW7_CHLVU|nr:hypothetical protein D9Q98_009280 [Chlorella vulgaris]
MAAQDHSSTWTHSLEEDGWYRAHVALRADLTAMAGMLESFTKQVDGGKAITREQAAAADKYVTTTMKFLHHHHANEDDIATPYLSTRFNMDEKICADHKRLETLMEAYSGGMKKLLASTDLQEQRTLLAGVKATFAQLDPLCRQHFQEEETVAMPLMRKHFTLQEIEKNVVAKILRGMGPDDVGDYFRTLSKEEFRSFAKQEHIPFFIRWILQWQVAKYKKNIWQPFEQQCLTAAH